MTVYDNQILTLPEFSILFISETVLAVTQFPDKLVETEKLSKVNFNKIVKRGKSTMGVPALNILVKGDIVYIYILEKRYVLSNLFEEAINFDNTTLVNNSKYIMYKKNDHFFIALRKDNFMYINPRNIVPKSFLVPLFYFKDMNNSQYNDASKTLSRYNIDTYTSILDNKIQLDEKLITDNSIVYKNDFNSGNFYFTDDPTITVPVNNRKPIVTYGFSRNNSKNYFDVSISNTFDDLKNYVKSNLNYNKNFFYNVDAQPTQEQLTLRALQLNIFLQTFFIDYKNLSSIIFDEENIYFKSFIKLLKLRQELIPFLYSAFKNTRFNNVDAFTQNQNYITFDKQLLIIPQYNEIDNVTNQNPLSIIFDNVYYDFFTGEKYDNVKLFELCGIKDIPIFALKGSIIPLFLDNKKNSPNEYTIKIYPGDNKNYTLYYDEYIENNVIKQSISTFNLEYSENNMLLNIKTNSKEDMIPSIMHIHLVNIKKDSSIRVSGSTYSLNYKTEDKTLIIDLFELNNNIEIEVLNNYGVEVSRKEEFLERKLETFFNLSSFSNKEKIVYKYKIKPFLHEGKKVLINRINKHTKFIPLKQRKYLHKIVEMYKID